MNSAMVKTLVFKDWYLSRHFLWLYVVGGLIGIALAVLGGATGLLIGGILLVGMVMGVGIHLVFSTIINERKLQTLPFIMSLPISVQEYTYAKIIANLTAFIVPWFVMSVAAIVTVYNWLDIPNGFIPFLTVMLLELAVCNVILLGVALISESEPWTVGIMSVCNASFGIVFYILGDYEGISQHLHGTEIVWNSTIYTSWAIEILIIILVLGLIFHFQKKKTDFL